MQGYFSIYKEERGVLHFLSRLLSNPHDMHGVVKYSISCGINMQGCSNVSPSYLLRSANVWVLTGTLISNWPSPLPYNIGNSFEKILNTEGVH